MGFIDCLLGIQDFMCSSFEFQHDRLQDNVKNLFFFFGFFFIFLEILK